MPAFIGRRLAEVKQHVVRRAGTHPNIMKNDDAKLGRAQPDRAG
jgi:hypothetical protein